MKKLLLAAVFGMLFLFAPAVSAQYGRSTYGDCLYGQPCPVPVVPTPPEEDPTPAKDSPLDPSQVGADLDNDGNDEYATDVDGEAENGYEVYDDEDGSTTVIRQVVDGNSTQYFVDTDSDGNPDVFWDPLTGYIAPITVTENDNHIIWRWKDEDGNTKTYKIDKEKRVKEKDVDGDGNNEQAVDADGDESNGNEVYIDPDGSSDDLVSFEDEEGNTEFIIDNDGDGQPDTYWDPGADYTSDVEVKSDSTQVGWYFIDSQGRERVYVVERFANTTDDTPTPAGSTGERRITGDGFGGAIYEGLGELVVSVPPVVAYSFPYILFSAYGILIFRLFAQARNELRRISFMKAMVNREQELVKEKQNFLMLASHYMRTPITTIKGQIELQQSLKTMSTEAVQKLGQMAEQLHKKAESVLEQLKNDRGLERIQDAPVEQTVTRQVVLSPPVIVPIVTVIIISIFAQFLFVDFRVTQPSLIDYLVQGMLVILLFQVFVSKYRQRQISRQKRAAQQSLLDKQRSLDEARSGFVDSVGKELAGDISELQNELIAQKQSGVDTSKIEQSTLQLKGVIDKFQFAGNLQAGQIQQQLEQFNTNDVIYNVFTQNQEKATSKKVVLRPDGENLMLVQNKTLVQSVLGSLVDNALKYSNDSSPVTVQTSTTGDMVDIAVENQGTEIDQRKAKNLFQPFSRLEDAETFNQEGLGFSLYLDNLIMKYLGGSIQLEPITGYGTRSHIRLPVLNSKNT